MLPTVRAQKRFRDSLLVAIAPAAEAATVVGMGRYGLLNARQRWAPYITAPVVATCLVPRVGPVLVGSGNQRAKAARVTRPDRFAGGQSLRYSTAHSRAATRGKSGGNHAP